jgi:hypothetical protein
VRDPFGPSIKFKIAWWRTQLWLIRQSRLVWYLVGILGGWILCSEYNQYISTGVWTTWPWQ